ncbi:MAG: hypothetical protein KJ712_03955 [Bacteroidetes bacterium]|nr:hypothetical protein [Bacteroidota bacterium]MBU1484850.1 hypothetical protein [Bacteroidota bacterium]MBU2045868.1 hypothetical protein [Bacteroidota bacterium]MBU2266551.1 hypothetical protein [Bacteroidota bacterium]MBU2376181.1 hypothetical protein [Bacteroidota bacterium]
MQKLSLSIVLIPVIAISLNIFLYLILLRKSENKSSFKQYILTVLLFAFLFNTIWEILQIPLYKEGLYSLSHILFCVMASVADAIMVLLIFFGFSLIYKDSLWIKKIDLSKILFLIIAGGIGAVLAETRHLSIGTWSYAASMPIIPVITVGLSPVLQFMILPLLIYWVAFKVI